jgi:hypothetical protein
MKNLGAVLAVGITAVIIVTIGVLNVLLASEPGPAAEIEEIAPPVVDAAAAPDVAAIQAAYDARELLLQAQIAELDAELLDRQAGYDQRAAELEELIFMGEEKLIQLQDQETVIREQIEVLLLAQSERAAAYESQRQQAYYQYQINIQQLQAQLDEGQVKLAEALARLSQ